MYYTVTSDNTYTFSSQSRALFISVVSLFQGYSTSFPGESSKLGVYEGGSLFEARVTGLAMLIYEYFECFCFHDVNVGPWLGIILNFCFDFFFLMRSLLLSCGD